MWKRRAEIAVLALLIAVAGVGSRPHVHVDAPEINVTALMPDRVDSVADVGMVALGVAVSLLD